MKQDWEIYRDTGVLGAAQDDLLRPVGAEDARGNVVP